MEDREYRRLEQGLIGPLRTMGKLQKEKQQAPSWWQGDEEATRASMAAMATMRRGRRRR